MENRSYPSGWEAAKDIIEAGRRLYLRGLVAANDGNLSVRTGEDEVWTTPTGVSKGFMSENDLVRVNLSGAVLGGEREPSSELRLHLALYRANPRLRAVVHTHAPCCTAFAASERELDARFIVEGELMLGVLPLVPYASAGSEELAEAAARHCLSAKGALLARHGLVTWGGSVKEALFLTESAENCAKVYILKSLLSQ